MSINICTHRKNNFTRGTESNSGQSEQKVRRGDFLEEDYSITETKAKTPAGKGLESEPGP